MSIKVRTKIATPLRYPKRDLKLFDIACNLTGFPMTDIVEACVNRSFQKSISQEVKEAAFAAAMTMAAPLINAIMEPEREGESTLSKQDSPRTVRLAAELEYALKNSARPVRKGRNGALEFTSQPGDIASVASLLKHCTREELALTVVEIIAHRLEVADDETALAFRRKVMEQQAHPNRRRMNLPVGEPANISSLSRWRTFLEARKTSYLPRVSAIKSSKFADDSRAKNRK